MKVRQAYPPNFEAILAAFPGAAGPGVIFCYGDTIFAPTNRGPIHPALHVHEGVHSKYQQLIGPEEWWDHYIASPGFRYAEEEPAHIAEYGWWMDPANKMSRNTRRAALAGIAARLASPLYGNLVTKEKARYLLKQSLTSLGEQPTSA